MSEGLLNCAVFKGMFSDELAVRYPAGDSVGTRVQSFFVPREKVINLVLDKNLGRLRVHFYRDDKTAWAVIPTEDQIAIPVADADLSSI